MLVLTVAKLLSFLVLSAFAKENEDILCLFTKSNLCLASECELPMYNQYPNDVTISNFTVLKICSEEYSLNSNITVYNKNAVAIKGLPSVIICVRSNIGFSFSNVNNLTLEDITIRSCGAFYSPQADHVTLKSSVYIVNSTDITLKKVNVTNSSGNGVTMFDNDGTVEVLNCTFEGSHNSNFTQEEITWRPDGNGLLIVLSYCALKNVKSKYDECNYKLGKNVIDSRYQINFCNFLQNKADMTTIPPELEPLKFGRGGGLSIMLNRHSSSNILEVTNCHFSENSGIWGGGLYIIIMGSSQNNTIKVGSSEFDSNTCSNYGGGGMDFGMVYNEGHLAQNTFLIEDCVFHGNTAHYGGGVGFFSSPLVLGKNKVTFKDCEWTDNEADTIGSAMDIAPQMQEISIDDLNIEFILENLNFATNRLTAEQSSKEGHSKGRGALSVIGFHISMKGNIIFDRNADSALYLTSAEIEFVEYSLVNFTNNIAFRGGAIYMQGFSSLLLKDNTELNFINNSAVDAGGAIYQSIHNIFVSKTCFIRYQGKTKNLTLTNVNVSFINNTAGERGQENTILGKYGHSIFATTIVPCIVSREPNSIVKFEFDHFVNSMFSNGSYDISTLGEKIVFDEKSSTEKNENTTWTAPGRIFELPIKTLNDLSQEVSDVYHASVTCLSVNCSIEVDDPYTYMSNKQIRFYGKPKDEALLTLKSTSARELIFKMNISIHECPPGHVYNHTCKHCECSAQTENRFNGIHHCNDANFSAILSPGYWVGYELSDIKFGESKHFLFGICPRDHCLGSVNYQKVSLPSNTSVAGLDRTICGKARTGRLCGKCRKGYTSNYHHSTYQCKKIKGDCNWGWLLYLVSEIVPVTLFFIVVRVLNISFTDGAVNGFILFIQLSDTMLIGGNGDLPISKHVELGLEAYRFVTRIWNLEFFAIDSWSFCMWKNATALDLLAFKYITILYASTLVALIVIILKYCKKQRINSILVKMKSESAAVTRRTIIHGISGFLVICYSEAVKVSLLILTPTVLFSMGEDGTNHVRHVVSLYNGELFYFRERHLAYAIPALLIVVIIGILPPLLLISYPLCYRVFSLLRISESRLAKALCTCIPLENFRPFFDSFQQSFKDEYRFFSGLYFLYRLAFLAAFAFTDSQGSFYAYLQGEITLMLAIHALCQPHKKRWHNILDGLLFCNLSIINVISLFNIHLTQYFVNKQSSIDILSTVQVVLFYLPLIYIAVLCTRKLISRCKQTPLLVHHATRRNATETMESQEMSDVFYLSAAECRLAEN